MIQLDHHDHDDDDCDDDDDDDDDKHANGGHLCTIMWGSRNG